MKREYNKFASYWLIISIIVFPAILLPIVPSSASSSDELPSKTHPELMCWTERKYDILTPLATRIIYYYRPAAISGSAYVVYVSQPYYFSYLVQLGTFIEGSLSQQGLVSHGNNIRSPLLR